MHYIWVILYIIFPCCSIGTFIGDSKSKSFCKKKPKKMEQYNWNNIISHEHLH